MVTLASASPNATTPSFLPQGVTPAGANWLTNGDTSQSRYSTLSQINLNTVKNLKVVWNQQFNTPDTRSARRVSRLLPERPDGPELHERRRRHGSRDGAPSSGTTTGP